MSEDASEKVDWIIPVAKDVPIGSVSSSKLSKAAEQHGVRLDIKTGKDGKIVADIYQEVVEGMPAPRKDPTKP